MKTVENWDQWVLLCTPEQGLDALATCRLFGLNKTAVLWLALEASFASKRWGENETLYVWVINLDAAMLFLSNHGKFESARLLEAAWVEATLSKSR